MDRAHNPWKALAVVILLIVLVLFTIPVTIFFLVENDWDAVRAYAAIISAIFAPITLIVALITLIIARKDRKEDQSLSVKDDFWFRTILLPAANKGLEEFLKKYRSIISGRAGELNSEDFVNDISELRESFKRLMFLSLSTVEKIEEIIDQLETYIGLHFVPEDDRTQIQAVDEILDIDQAHLAIIETLSQLHTEIIQNRV